MRIKGKETVVKSAKKTIVMPGMARARLSNTVQLLEGLEIIKLHNNKFCIKEWKKTHNSCRNYEIKLNRLHIGHTRLIPLNLMSINSQ